MTSLYMRDSQFGLVILKTRAHILIDFFHAVYYSFMFMLIARQASFLYFVHADDNWWADKHEHKRITNSCKWSIVKYIWPLRV